MHVACAKFLQVRQTRPIISESNVSKMQSALNTSWKKVG